MRTNANVQPGQLWRDSDPRRLRLLRVVRVAPDEAIVRVLYPAGLGLPGIALRRFVTTGPKGLTRVA